METNRSILLAKRKNERSVNNKSTAKPDPDKAKQAPKRPLPASSPPKKNIANDRLKRLRTTLKEDVNRRLTTPKIAVSRHERKRGQAQQVNQDESVIVQKAPRGCENASPTIFHTNITKSSFNFGAIQTDSSFRFTAGSVQSTSTSKDESLTIMPQNSTTKMETDEDMEWDAIGTACEADVANEQAAASLCDNKVNISSDSSITNDNDNNIFVVVDTNIFISDLALIKNIVTMSITGGKQPIIFIPWMVVEELDFIKDDANRKNDLKWKAKEAIKYIDSVLTSKHDRMRGQSLDEAAEQKNIGNSQDNKIIACCLQVVQKYGTTYLLSNDVNLRNKAQFNKIPSYSSKDILNAFQVVSANKRKSEKILSTMTVLCAFVIRSCASKSFGKAFDKMHLAKFKPRSLQECTKAFKKYWISVFQEVLMKPFRQRIDDLNKFINEHKNIQDGSPDLDELVRLCVRICIYLKDVEQCQSRVESTIRELNNIKES